MGKTEDTHRYFIDLKGTMHHRRSVAAMIAGRRCFACRSADPDGAVPTSEPKDYVKQIASQCSDTPDFLLPDTPLKESLFRVILAGRNLPMSVDQIRAALMARWADSNHVARDASEASIRAILNNSLGYCIISQSDTSS